MQSGTRVRALKNACCRRSSSRCSTPTWQNQKLTEPPKIPMMNSLSPLSIGKLYGEANPKLFVAMRGASLPGARSSGGTSHGPPGRGAGRRGARARRAGRSKLGGRVERHSGPVAGAEVRMEDVGGELSRQRIADRRI